ncbi:Phospholipid phosphatase 6 [Camponotus japonicus]
METSEKRQIPTLLRKVLAVDAYLTDEFVKLVEKFLPLRQLKVHYKLLEISCHGIVWLASSLVLIWILNSKSLYQMQVNLLIGLLLDILLIAVIKAITRRRRPTSNDDSFTIGPDKYSFPSGHASRATFIVLLLRRHHIFDVLVGVFLDEKVHGSE